MKNSTNLLVSSLCALAITACNGGNESSDSNGGESVKTPPTNIFPVSNAGMDKHVIVNNSITITGTGTDSDGNVTSFQWKKDSETLASTASFTYTPTKTGIDTLTLSITDDDGATHSDSLKVSVTYVPINPGTDSDGDTISDVNDIDDDNDGVPDSKDAFPKDSAESIDTDGDGQGNNTDIDDDGDGVADGSDAFPFIASESKDSDGDGIGDNADTNQNDGTINNPNYAEHYTRDEYRQMLFSDPIIDHNKHPVGSKYKSDLEGEGWPEIAHVLLRHVHANLQAGLFSSDSVSGEGMNYHFFWMAGFAKFAEALEGYVDPVAWTPPTGVEKITKALTHDEIIPRSERLNNMVSAALMLTLPDGSDCGAHDTGLQEHDMNDEKSVSAWGAGGEHYAYGVERKSISYLLPGFGQFGLGDGTPGDPWKQTQSILHFSPKYTDYAQNGHAHSDTLMMGLYGKGRNLLSFPGHQRYRHGPHNKNMVSLGKEWQNHWTSDLTGRLETYASLPGLQIGRVDATHIMHGGGPSGSTNPIVPNRYRRTLLQNTVDVDKSYTLDIFEVDGGSEHNYVIRGSGVLDQEYPATNLSVDTASLPYSGSPWDDEFQNTKKMDYDANKSFWIDFKFSDNQKLGSRTHIPAQGEEGTLYTSFIKDMWDETASIVHPYLMLYRSGIAPLKSTFVAVHEVMDGSGSSFISSVTQNSLNNGKAIAVTVTLRDGRVDTYLVSVDGPQTMTHNEVSATALIAASSSLNAKSDLWMVEGTNVTNGSRTLTKSYDAQSNVVSRVYRKENGDDFNAFETPMNLTDGYELAGQTLLLEHFKNNKLLFTNGHTIERVESITNGSRIHLRFDPGVEISGLATKEIYYPGRKADSAILKFVPTETTVPRITHVEPGKEQWQRMTARVARAVQTNDKVVVTTVPSNESFNYVKTNDTGAITNGTGQSSLTIEEDMSVSLKVDNLTGLATQPKITERFYTLFPALPGMPTDQGLKMKKYSGGNVNFDLNNNAWDNSGALNYYDLGRYNSVTINGLTYAHVPGSSSSLPNEAVIDIPRGAFIDGYINVPTTGLYNFYTRLDAHAQLKIDDKVIIQQAGMRRMPLWDGEVYLEKGLHKIFVHYYVHKWPGFAVMWKGPGIPYCEIPRTILYKSIK